MHPDRAAMQEMLDAARAAPRRDARALSSVKQIMSMTMSGFRSRMLPAEGAGLLLGVAVERRPSAHRLPGGVRLVRLALAAADVDDLEAGLDQPRHQIGADMAAAADDHDTRHERSPEKTDDN